MPTGALLPDARNLGLLLNRLENSDAGPVLNAILRRFLPRLRRVTTLVESNAISVFFHEEGLKAPVPSTRISDGTMSFLALAATLLSPDPPSLLCVEEPELGLHPDAMTLVAELLVRASDRMQLVVTTHSDALVSALTDHVESVLVCEHLGGTRFKRMEAGRLAHWLDKYRLGELWRIGELGGNP